MLTEDSIAKVTIKLGVIVGVVRGYLKHNIKKFLTKPLVLVSYNACQFTTEHILVTIKCQTTDRGLKNFH